MISGAGRFAFVSGSKCQDFSTYGLDSGLSVVGTGISGLAAVNKEITVCTVGRLSAVSQHC